MIITYDQPGLAEHEMHHFSIEASMLGLPPGQWPQWIDTTMGNRQAFTLAKVEKHGDEIGAVVYRQNLGCIKLTIFND